MLNRNDYLLVGWLVGLGEKPCATDGRKELKKDEGGFLFFSFGFNFLIILQLQNGFLWSFYKF